MREEYVEELTKQYEERHIAIEGGARVGAVKAEALMTAINKLGLALAAKSEPTLPAIQKFISTSSSTTASS